MIDVQITQNTQFRLCGTAQATKFDRAKSRRLRRQATRYGSAIVVACGLFASAQPAQAQATRNLVSACSGVSLPPSVVTGILAPVVGGIVSPIQNTVNPILGVVGGLLSIPTLNIDAAGLLANAAAGKPINLQVLNTNGTIVGPTDRCDLTSDSLGLNTQGGISIGGNRITGLGTNGLEAVAGEANSIAFGNSAVTAASSTGSIAIGTGASVGPNASGSIAFGNTASVTAANSIALGAGSVAARGPQLAYAAVGLSMPQNSAGEVSVGAAGAERQITNVAAGTAATDAVNLAQLQGVASQISATGAVNAVQYDGADRTVVTLAGAGGTTLTNVKAGAVNATSTDAVNGAQLNATNQNVANNTTAITNLGNTIAGNTTAITNLGNTVAGNTTAITNLTTTVAGNTTAITDLTTTVAGNTTAITNLGGAVTTNTTAITNLTNNVANGAIGPVQYSNPDSPTTPNGGTVTNDVTLVGAAAAPVALHNVAAGSVAAGSTDAVNGGQLHAVALASANALTYDTDFNDNRTNTVTLSGGNVSAPVTITNVAAATVSATSTDAVNGSQLYATNQTVATAQTTANTALALGQNSVQYDNANRTDVTLGDAGAGPVSLHNVAAGISPTDAVNVAQLTSGLGNAVAQANSYTDQRFASLNFDLKHIRKDADAGTAGALAAAGLPQAYEAGKGMISVSAGAYGSQTAVALGASKAMSDGHTVVKLFASYDTSHRAGGTAGVGYQF